VEDFAFIRHLKYFDCKRVRSGNSQLSACAISKPFYDACVCRFMDMAKYQSVVGINKRCYGRFITFEPAKYDFSVVPVRGPSRCQVFFCTG
jgi:hypothetical protein